MNEIINVIILLVRLTFKLIPPAVWLTAVFIVFLWLAMMVKMWQPDGRSIWAEIRHQLPITEHRSCPLDQGQFSPDA